MGIGTGKCCVKCRTYYAPKKNGVRVLETYEDGKTPYKIWVADLYECPGCGHQLVAGFGASPISEHYMTDFQLTLQTVNITINGCPRRLPSQFRTGEAFT